MEPSPDPVIVVRHGQLLETALDDRWGLGTATFSEDGLHRFRLSRVWDSSRRRINFLMLNPSTADARVLDPTLRRCARFAESWDAGAFEVTNVFALRSTDPRELYEAGDPVGPGNDDAIKDAARAADVVVVAWGVRAKYGQREAAVRDLLAEEGVRPYCLRRTLAGHPGHPLYVRKDAELMPWA